MNENACILTAGDFATLGRLYDEWSSCGRDIAAHLRRKMDRASVVFPSDLPHDVASLESQIIYSGPDGKTCQAQITALMLLDDQHLPVSRPLGLALLGRREGEEVEVNPDGNSIRRFTLVQVVGQPERTWPNRFSPASSEELPT